MTWGVWNKTMDEGKLTQLEKEKKVEHIAPRVITIEELSAQVQALMAETQSNPFDKNDIQFFLNRLRAIKQSRTTAPTNVPKNFLEQIEFYQSGSENRLYLFINNAWTMIATNKLLNDAVYMFTDTASDIGGYDTMVALDSYSVGALVSTPVSVTTSPTLLHTFATISGHPNLVQIPSGLLICHYETEKVSGSNNYYTYFEIYKRASGGTETLIGTSDGTTETASNNKVQHTVSAFLVSPVTLLATDRIVVKIYGKMLSASATINFNYDDNTTARLTFPYYTYS